jgi:hypothetical protein
MRVPVDVTCQNCGETITVEEGPIAQAATSASKDKPGQHFIAAHGRIVHTCDVAEESK